MEWSLVNPRDQSKPCRVASDAGAATWFPKPPTWRVAPNQSKRSLAHCDPRFDRVPIQFGPYRGLVG
jgi:hypothetical protein